VLGYKLRDFGDIETTYLPQFIEQAREEIIDF